MPFNPLTDARKKVLLVLGVSRAWSDSGGTTLCGNGDPCRKLEDLSGNGYHAVVNTQVVNGGVGQQAVPPVYRTGGLGGPYLDFSAAGSSLMVVPDAGLNPVQGTHDYTLYGCGTNAPTTLIGGNGIMKICDQCGDTEGSGPLVLQCANNFLAQGGTGQTVQVTFPHGEGNHLYYLPANTYTRFGFSKSTSQNYRFLFNGLPASGYYTGSPPADTPNTTGNIIIGGKYFQTWGDWFNWKGQWHGLCLYQTSLTPAEVWQLDQYLLGVRSQAHPLASQKWWLVWDGNSMAAIDAYLTPVVVGLLGIDPSTVASFAYHFKSTSDMITNGGEVDALVAQVKASYPSIRTVLCWNELTNDAGPATTAAGLYANAQTYAANRLAGGADAVVAATMLDQQGMTGPDEARRAALNALLTGTQTGPFFRAADWTQSPTLEPWNSTGFTDSLHPSYAGDAAGGPYFATQIAAASVNPTPIIRFLQAACGGC